MKSSVSVYLIGLDGSGKSTVGKLLVSRLREACIPSSVFYARHFPLLLFPLKVMARFMFLSDNASSRDYRSYSKSKKRAGMRYPILAILYCGAWCADFVLVTWLRLLVLAPLTRQRRVIDRYFLDVAINISSSLGWDIEHAMKIAKVLAHLLPKPSCIVYLRVPAETAYSRKKDIPHIEYLNEREAFYRAVSEKIGAIVVDGTLPVEHVVEVILKSCWPNLQPSHQVH